MKVITTAALTTIGTPVTEGEDVTDLIDGMFQIMYESNGVGLAANQVGSIKRVFVMHANGFKQEFINPVITKRRCGKSTAKEGCLSYPGLLMPMTRDKQITIEGFDRDWKPIKRKLRGVAARCAQHELDHLNGITIKDGIK